MRIELEPGDEVTSGQTLLAMIVPSPPELLNPRELAAARARVEAASSAVQRQAAVIDKAKAELDYAETELARTRRLIPTRAVSQSELEVAELRYRSAVEEFRTATVGEEIARFELEQAQAQLLQVDPETPPEEVGGKVAIHAPISGRVLRVMQESSVVVAAGTPLLEIGDPTDLELEIDVLTTDAVKVEPQMKVIVEHWGGPRPLEGHVDLIERSAFTKISALGVEEQRVNVIVDLESPNDQRASLGDAFRVEARIVIWESPEVLRVPVGALFRQGDQWAVFTVANDRAQLRTIQLGHRNDQYAEVQSGLDPGDRVILYPSDQVAADVRVEIEETGGAGS
jgi:HlyD family secretion protein